MSAQKPVDVVARRGPHWWPAEFEGKYQAYRTAKMANTLKTIRLGKHENALLEAICASESNKGYGEEGIPLYVDHIPDSGRFNYMSDALRWLKGVEKKGLIRIHKRFFLHSTELGRSALAAVRGGSAVGATSSVNAEMLAVLEELRDSAAYWSEYDVPVGIVDRINTAIANARGVKPEGAG